MKSQAHIDNSSKLTTVTTKLSLQEKEIIQSKARQAGMTVSRYMRESALGKKLFHVFTDEEKALLSNLESDRSRITNFGNALHGMKREKRMGMFQSIPFMREWYKHTVHVVNAVTEFLDSIYELYGKQYRKPKTFYNDAEKK